MFKQKILFFILSFSTFSTAIAKNDMIICPTVDAIRQGQFNSWQPLYKDGEELASSKDVDKFKANVLSFDVAKWSTEYLESAHCFYRGKDPIVDRIVFAQDAWQPIVNNYWSWLIPYKFAECRSTNLKDCGFIT